LQDSTGKLQELYICILFGIYLDITQIIEISFCIMYIYT